MTVAVRAVPARKSDTVADHFTVVGESNDGGRTRVGVVDYAGDETCYAIVGVNTDGKTCLQISVMPGLFAVNGVVCPTLAMPPVLGQRSGGTIPVDVESMVGHKVLLSGLTSKKFMHLNNCVGTITGPPQLPKDKGSKQYADEVVYVPVRIVLPDGKGTVHQLFSAACISNVPA